jgi:hypothetical protein
MTRNQNRFILFILSALLLTFVTRSAGASLLNCSWVFERYPAIKNIYKRATVAKTVQLEQLIKEISSDDSASKAVLEFWTDPEKWLRVATTAPQLENLIMLTLPQTLSSRNPYEKQLILMSLLASLPLKEAQTKGIAGLRGFFMPYFLRELGRYWDIHVLHRVLMVVRELRLKELLYDVDRLASFYQVRLKKIDKDGSLDQAIKLTIAVLKY